MAVVQASVVPFAQALAGKPSFDTEGLWGRRSIELTLRLAMLLSCARHHLRPRQDDNRQAHHRSKKTSPCDAHQGSGSRTRRTRDVSNKTTQILAINPDLRTVAASYQHVVHRESFRPCTHTLPAVWESLTSPTTTFQVPHSHPSMQPYDAGRNGIGWVPERAVVECILRLDVSLIRSMVETSMLFV